MSSLWCRRALRPAKRFKQGAGELESADWRWFPGSAGLLVEAPRGDLVLVPAKIVAELVEVGEAGLGPEGVQVALGLVPEIRGVEEDPGRLLGPAGEL